MRWFDLIGFFEADLFTDITRFLTHETNAGKTILPEYEDILNAYYVCPYEDTKVVILGQDPYPTPGHAHGLAFSVQSHVKPLPKSLQNIYKELSSDLGVESPKTGNLTPWARQGVLLLNTSLTVESGKPGSHKDLGWSLLVEETLDVLSLEKKNIVFILWGRHAQDHLQYIQNRSDHLILQASHPSPYSANQGFFGSKPFSKTNTYLTKHGKEPIRWT